MSHIYTLYTHIDLFPTGEHVANLDQKNKYVCFQSHGPTKLSQ